MLRNTCFLKQIYLFSLSLSLVTRDVLMKQHANKMASLYRLQNTQTWRSGLVWRMSRYWAPM